MVGGTTDTSSASKTTAQNRVSVVLGDTDDRVKFYHFFEHLIIVNTSVDASTMVTYVINW